MKSIWILMLMIMVAVSVVAQSEKTNGQQDKEILSPKEFKNKMEKTPDAVLLDVRTPEEVQQGKIEGAVNIDFNNPDFEKDVKELDKDKVYFVYCARGGRSSKAYAIMKDSGFKHVYDLEGGYNAWKDSGLPVK